MFIKDVTKKNRHKLAGAEKSDADPTGKRKEKEREQSEENGNVKAIRMGRPILSVIGNIKHFTSSRPRM